MMILQIPINLIVNKLLIKFFENSKKVRIIVSKNRNSKKSQFKNTLEFNTEPKFTFLVHNRGNFAPSGS